MSILCTIVLLLIPASAFAATASSTKVTTSHPQPQVASWTSIAGHEFKLTPGQQIDMPYTDGTVHMKLSVDPSTVSASSSLTQANAMHPDSAAVSCNTAWNKVWWTNVFGQIIISYTIYQTWCYDGTNITERNPQTDSSVGIDGWNLTSHSTSQAWFSRPQSAYAHGNFTFVCGIPTPYGNLGFGSVSGWVEIYVYGNGSTYAQGSN